MISNSRPRILIISKGGKGAGMGHLVRVATLFGPLSAYFNMTLLVRHDRYGRDFLRKRSLRFQEYDNSSELIRFIEKSGRYALIIIDMLYVSINILKKLEAHCDSVIVFDDMQKLSNKRVKGAIICPQETFKRDVKAIGQTLLMKGTDFFPIRPFFRPYRKANIFRAPVRNVMLNLGGGTPPRYILSVTKLLDKMLPKKIFLHVVTGYIDGKLGSFSFSKRVLFYKKVENIASLIAKMDLGIVSSGFIKLEFMFIGTPFCLVSINAHQRVLAEKFSSKGYGIYLGNLKDMKARQGNFYKKVERVISSVSLRKEIFTSSRRLVDGRGRERFLKLAMGLIKKEKT